MGDKADVWQGTLALMVLRTLDTLGPLHGYGIARRIEQTSENLLSVNYGTLYPALLKLEQEGYIASEWGLSDNKRKAKYYKLTRAGRKQLEREIQGWGKPRRLWRGSWPQRSRRDGLRIRVARVRLAGCRATLRPRAATRAAPTCMVRRSNPYEEITSLVLAFGRLIWQGAAGARDGRGT